MEQNGDQITFPAVARRSGVSAFLLHADAVLVARIAIARREFLPS